MTTSSFFAQLVRLGFLRAMIPFVLVIPMVLTSLALIVFLPATKDGPLHFLHLFSLLPGFACLYLYICILKKTGLWVTKNRYSSI